MQQAKEVFDVIQPEWLRKLRAKGHKVERVFALVGLGTTAICLSGGVIWFFNTLNSSDARVVDEASRSVEPTPTEELSNNVALIYEAANVTPNPEVAIDRSNVTVTRSFRLDDLLELQETAINESNIDLTKIQNSFKLPEAARPKVEPKYGWGLEVYGPLKDVSGQEFVWVLTARGEVIKLYFQPPTPHRANV